jgi:hypothetical protein
MCVSFAFASIPSFSSASPFMSNLISRHTIDLLKLNSTIVFDKEAHTKNEGFGVCQHSQQSALKTLESAIETN